MMSQKEELREFPPKLAATSTPRPHLTAQTSSSVPSSPYQRPRKISFGDHSPSSDKATKNASPDSEPEKRLRSASKVPTYAGCKFETGMAFSRRRIPYSIGGDQLERAKAPPKKYLNPSEEEKLSGDMRELYDRILPTRESESNRTKFIDKLERILNQQWPGNEIKVHVFGSSGNMLCTSDSDGEYFDRKNRGYGSLIDFSRYLHNHTYEVSRASLLTSQHTCRAYDFELYGH